MTPTNFKSGFAPIADKHSRILILGSMPGDESIRKQEYYGHPQNRFWKILYSIFKEPLDNLYSQKIEFALKHQIAIWDVIQQAERKGSMDSDIKHEQTNPINQFIQSHPELTTIGFNGNKAFQTFKKGFLLPRNVRLVQLPSSSPANARYSLSHLVEIWESELFSKIHESTDN